MEVHEQLEGMEQPPQSPFKIPSIPGTPLQQLSSERLNQRIPHSPSLPLNFDPNSHRSQHRLSDAADVKARIAMLNSMSQNGSPKRCASPTKAIPSSSSHAAIQRAVLGREEAEATLNSMASQLESAKARERLVAERVESLMEQLAEARSRQRHERHVYEKEVKNAKKTEYKAELAVIKLQEELREAKGEIEAIKARAEHDKAEKEKARQEAFERAYAVAGMTEEMQTLKEKLKVVEQERDSAVAMAASRMAIQEQMQAEPMPPNSESSQEQAEEISKAKRKTPMPSAAQTYNALLTLEDVDLDADDCPTEIKFAALQRQISQLREERREKQELIHFMNMQCQFKTCPCRRAEQNGFRFVHDYEYDDKMQAKNGKRRKIEDDRPRPKLLSWLQKREMKLARQAIPSFSESTSKAPESKSLDEETELRERDNGHEANSTHEQIEAPAPLPPVQLNTNEAEIADQVAEVEVAAQIALPSPIFTPDHTAQLEEITQVMVEPGTSSEPFYFSSSVSNVKHSTDLIPTSYESQESMEVPEDLFDLSPPKQAIPRPATAMGIITLTSPICLVPDSPFSALTQSEDSTDNASLITRVALNDTSPVRQARLHQRSQSRNAIRIQSRGRSPATRPLLHSESKTSRPASASDTTSPVSGSLFPKTPVTRHAHIHDKSQTQPRSHQYANGFDESTESTMTTRIPLRDESELVLPPAPDSTNEDEPRSLTTARSMTSLKDPLATVPGTPVTREAALAQIRARRDRARSLNTRHRREEQQVDDNEHREMKTPGSVARRGMKLDLGAKLGLTGERGRDVSHASAPGRF